MKRTISFLLAAVLLLSLCACGKKTAGAPEPTAAPTPSAAPEQTAEARNNCSLYVGLDGDVYYRQYDAADVEASGMLGQFAAVPGAEKQMMVRHTDGSTEVLVSDTGAGTIAILGGRFYLQTSEYADGKVYSVDMTGENRTELLDGCILAADEAGGRLICQSGTDIVRKGALLFQSVRTDGSDTRELARTEPDLYGYPADTAATVVCMQAVGDNVYFSYGAYAGTAHVFQGGGILRVGADGSGLTKIAGTAQEGFYVSRRGGTDYLYYVPDTEESAVCRNVTTGEEEKAAFASPIDTPYVDSRTAEGGVYSDETGTPTVLFTAKDLAGYDGKYGCGEETLYLVDQVNIVGSLVFFRILRGTHDAANDVGWRTSYTRTSAEVYCRDLTTGQVAGVFAY